MKEVINNRKTYENSIFSKHVIANTFKVSHLDFAYKASRKRHLTAYYNQGLKFHIRKIRNMTQIKSMLKKFRMQILSSKIMITLFSISLMNLCNIPSNCKNF